MWNEEIKRKYIRELELETELTININYNTVHTMVFPEFLEEHMCMIKGVISRMPEGEKRWEMALEDKQIQIIPEELQEHFDALQGKMEGRALRSMGAVDFAESEVKDQLKKIR